VAEYKFPEGFLWGTATSSHQIEGAFGECGRSESIWDRFESTRGKIEDATNASVACDHYSRWREDIELMKWLGVNAYRFSIAWPRILPRGRGPVNTEGLGFYDALVDALLEAGIEPFVTLYHWDLPQVLEESGGWTERETAEAFVEYTAAIASRLGDRVRHWTTHNEPWCISTLGYEQGHHAPGRKNPAEALRAAHHLLLSHGWATGVLRSEAAGAEVGIVLNLVPAVPASDSAGDIDAARWFDGFFNRWFLDPIFRGRYPVDAIEDRLKRGHVAGTGLPAGADLPFVRPGDLDIIAAPLDFLGVNYYSRNVLREDESGRPAAVTVVPEEELTDMGWEVYPRGLHDLLLRLKSEYGPSKVYITENGAAYSDGPDKAGRIEDQRRVEFLRGHLLEAHRAIEDGVPLAGYFVWSLLDNFEWAHGYTKRFGLYWVNFFTQERIPKKSAFWYRDVVAANAVDDGLR
jgi:beta-glucosidase